MNIMQQLLQDRAEVVAKWRKLIDDCESQKRDMHTDEEKLCRDYEGELDKLNNQIRERNKIDRYTIGSDGIINPLNGYSPVGQPEPRNDTGFANIAEMMWAIKEARNGRRDDRLEPLRESRIQSMGTGSEGGYALGEQFSSVVRMAAQQGGIVRSRATVIEPGDPPDATITFPALNQTSGKNNYGGIVLAHQGEGQTISETDLALQEISLTPKQISAFIVATNKLLRNWSAGGTFISTMLRNAMIAAEDYDFLRGDGINKALGVINSSAAIAYNRAGAGAIAYADIYGMVAKLKMGGSPVWLASQTVIPSLAALIDSGSHAVFVGGGNLAGSVAGALPSTLFGIPLVFSDRLPALGTKGDLCLLDLSYYVVKDGSGPWIDLSTDFLFTQDKSVFKLVWNVDGKAWLTEPLRLEGDSAQQVSPFVILN